MGRFHRQTVAEKSAIRSGKWTIENGRDAERRKWEEMRCPIFVFPGHAITPYVSQNLDRRYLRGSESPASRLVLYFGYQGVLVM